MNRRHFLVSSATAAAGIAISARAASGFSADKLNLGLIGAGGRGAANLTGVRTENIVAVCDVDDTRAARSFASLPDATRYRDFRRMLELEQSLDAVVISTPDHTHAVAAVMAMQLGKHVYCEKPLTHTIHEVRTMRAVAEEHGVATQMGIQGHSYDGTRQAVEVIRVGAIGEVREVHVWTDRPVSLWPQGAARPVGVPAVPDTLSWDLWLGPATARPYHPDYVPFKWRGRWDFGTGAIGDMGIHNLDTAFWALDLGLPTSVEILDSAPVFADTAPLWSRLKLRFGARGDRPPVDVIWYSGAELPPAELFFGEDIASNGSLVIGDRGTLYTRTWHGGSKPDDWFLMLPREQFVDYEPPVPTLPRSEDHHQEWINACKGGPASLANFSYASVSTESMLLGALALRLGSNIEWDAENMQVVGCPEADQFIRPEYRRGWIL